MAMNRDQRPHEGSAMARCLLPRLFRITLSDDLRLGSLWSSCEQAVTGQHEREI
jgi:hypothetical protein